MEALKKSKKNQLQNSLSGILNEELLGRNIIIEPNSPTEGQAVTFIEVNKAPVELMEYKKA